MLYNDARPLRFSQVIGQDNAVEVLKKKLKEGSVPHAILFSGPSGCGKSTLAAILSSEMEAGEVQKINCADFRGIDTVREIRESNRYKPFQGGRSVYILEEIVQLPKATQQAFLDELENPPSWVFFFATASETSGLLPTFLSRFFQIKLDALSKTHLKAILTMAVGGDVPGRDVMSAILDNSGGSARVALEILELVLATPESKQLEVAGSSTRNMQEKSEFLVVALLRKASWEELHKIVMAIDASAVETVKRQVSDYCMKCMQDQSKMALCCEIITGLSEVKTKPELMAACFGYWSEYCQEKRRSMRD